MALNIFNLIKFAYISTITLSPFILTLSAVNETDITIVVEDDDLLTDDSNGLLIQANNIRFA